MKRANLSTVKNDLSRYVAHVRRGGHVRILVQGVAAADLVPVRDADTTTTNDGALLDEMERRGVLRRGAGGIPDEILERGPRSRGRAASHDLVQERRTGR